MLLKLKDDYQTFDSGSWKGWLSPKRYYMAMGILIIGKDISILTTHYEYKSFLFPIQLFDMLDNGLPSDFKVYSSYADSVLGAIEPEEENFMWIGYEELVNDRNHYENLMEREEKETRIFVDRYNRYVNEYYYEYSIHHPIPEFSIEFSDIMLPLLEY